LWLLLWLRRVAIFPKARADLCARGKCKHARPIVFVVFKCALIAIAIAQKQCRMPVSSWRVCFPRPCVGNKGNRRHQARLRIRHGAKPFALPQDPFAIINVAVTKSQAALAVALTLKHGTCVPTPLRDDTRRGTRFAIQVHAMDFVSTRAYFSWHEYN